MTKSHAALLKRMERKALNGGLPPTRAELAALCALARQQDAALTERAIPGHVARMIDVLLERVSAGDSPRAVCADYGFEWNRGPSLAVLVRLVRLREAVRECVGHAGNRVVGECCQRTIRALRRAGGGRRKTR